MVVKSEPMADNPVVLLTLLAEWLCHRFQKFSSLFFLFFFAAQLCQPLDKTSSTSQRTRVCTSLQTSPSYIQQLVVLEFRRLLHLHHNLLVRTRFIYLLKWEKHAEMFCRSQQTTAFPQNKLACNTSKPIKGVINETQHL